MSTVMGQTLLVILGSYALMWILQLLAWPVVKKAFSGLPDEGWALGRIGVLLISSLGIWELSYLGLAVNTKIGIVTSLLLIALVGVRLVGKQGGKWLVPKRESWRLIIMEEYLFLVGFGVICLVRAFLPNLDSLEKFMDYGFVVSYMNSPTLPAMDMWQAGKAINYYSFGHFWASVLIRFLGARVSVGYNLVLGFIAGQALSLAFLASFLLGKTKNIRRTLAGGLLGSLLVVFGGNSHTLWYAIKNFSLKGYWYADATRFIHNTIHEFPGYSLVVSDLHGHLLDLPVVLFFIIVFYLFTKGRRAGELVVLGGLLAIMMMTNTWDVPIYGLLLGVWFLMNLLKEPKQIWWIILSFGTIFGVMVLVSLPWWVKFQPISSGIFGVSERSPLWQLAVLWGGAMAINLLSWLVKGSEESSLGIKTLIITSILLILIPELVYAKDIYPDHPRANTMFKLTYQASIMVGLTFGGLVGRVIDNLREKVTIMSGGVLVGCLVIFGSLIVFPTVSFPSFYENFKTFYGLDGEIWLKEKSPEKYHVVSFLRQNRDGKNMVEAVGDSYTEQNVVSAYAGVPTIQGWRVHEWLWRGGYEAVAVREKQVREIYEGKEESLAREILSSYNIGWILVGSDEEEGYLINHPKIKKLGKEVWRMGESYLVKVE